MNKYLYTFLESIWLNKKNINKIILNISWELIDNKILLKNVINFILKNNEGVNNEVEKKILNIDIESLLNKLNNLWAEKTFDGKVDDNRYDFDSMEFKNNWILLRVRKTNKWNYITFKKQVDSNKKFNKWCSINNEFEMEINNVEKTVNSILNLWLKEMKWKKYTKYRISYELEWIHFDFDKYDGIPWLLEIESNNEENVNKWIKKLWLIEYDSVKFWYKKLKQLYWLNKVA